MDHATGGRALHPLDVNCSQSRVREYITADLVYERAP
jgi:hypothetical protein